MANLRPMKAVLVVISAMKETLGCGTENKGGQGGKERHVWGDVIDPESNETRRRSPCIRKGTWKVTGDEE